MKNVNGRTVFAISARLKNLELIREVLEEEDFGVVETSQLEDVISTLQTHSIDSALVDITGYGRQIWDTCELLRKEDIPFIIISRKESKQLEQIGKRYGADKTMGKPLLIQELVDSIRYLIF